QEVGDPERADVDDDAGDDLVDLVADAEPGEEQPDEGSSEERSEHADDDTPRDARSDRRGARTDQELALDGDVQHAAPLGQDASEGAEGDRDGKLEAAGDHTG